TKRRRAPIRHLDDVHVGAVDDDRGGGGVVARVAGPLVGGRHRGGVGQRAAVGRGGQGGDVDVDRRPAGQGGGRAAVDQVLDTQDGGEREAGAAVGRVDRPGEARRQRVVERHAVGVALVGGVVDVGDGDHEPRRVARVDRR